VTAEETRRVPIPPELVTILRTHIDTFGVAPDGRVFSSDRGQPVASTAISNVWAEARALALTPAQVASPLPGRPYDLRHAAVSLWLAAGVPAPRVAERAGHSVEVLLRVYAKCLDDGEDIANTRIDAALRDGQQEAAERLQREDAEAAKEALRDAIDLADLRSQAQAAGLDPDEVVAGYKGLRDSQVSPDDVLEMLNRAAVTD
jgi:hypothetical protein